MPDDQAKEKSQLLEQFGAHVEFVKPASIVNAKHYVNEAKRRAKAIEGGHRICDDDIIHNVAIMCLQSTVVR